MGRGVFVVSVAIVLISLFLFHYYYSPLRSFENVREEKSIPPPHSFFSKTPRTSNLRKFNMAQLVDKNEPIVFNRFAKEWPALSKWKNFSYLANSIPGGICKRVYSHSSPLFGPIWRSEKPMSLLSSISWSNPSQNVDLPAEKFFSSLLKEKNNQQEKSFYWNEDLTTLVPETMYDAIGMRDLIWNPENSQLNLWVGKDVMTHLHFDSFINFYVQIVGNKEFVICPPNQSSRLLPYPFLHPSYSHSQLDIPVDSPASFLSEEANCSVALLRPGDLLFLPPYYWHHVSSIGAGVSINSWSVTRQAETFQNSVSHLEKLFSLHEEVVQDESGASSAGDSLLMFAKSVLNSIQSNLCSRGKKTFCASDFLATIMKQRYHTFLGEDKTTTLLVNQLPITEPCPSPTHQIQRGFVDERFERFIDEIAQELGDIGEDELKYWFSNLAEMVILEGSSNDILKALSFFYYCVLNPLSSS